LSYLLKLIAREKKNQSRERERNKTDDCLVGKKGSHAKQKKGGEVVILRAFLCLFFLQMEREVELEFV